MRIFSTYGGGVLECLTCALLVLVWSKNVTCPRCGWTATITERSVR